LEVVIMETNPLDPTGEDWIKSGSWDIWYTQPDGELVPASTVTQFAAAMGHGDLSGAGLTDLLERAQTWTSWGSAPDSLKAEAARLVADVASVESS